MRAAAVSGKRSQRCIARGRGQRVFFAKRHPLRTLGEMSPDDCDVIAHGIDAVIGYGHPLRTLGEVGPDRCDVIAHGVDAVIGYGHPLAIFSPDRPAETQALRTPKGREGDG